MRREYGIVVLNAHHTSYAVVDESIVFKDSTTPVVRDIRFHLQHLHEQACEKHVKLGFSCREITGMIMVGFLYFWQAEGVIWSQLSPEFPHMFEILRASDAASAIVRSES